MNIHSAIEFGNRTLTFLLAAIAVGTFVAAWQSGRREVRGLALLMGLAIPAQAVIGGITVLTDLNPWVVSLHLLVSLAIIALAVLFLRRVDRALPPLVAARPRLLTLAWLTYAVAWVVLYVGTVVTGSGPHAGDIHVPRNGLDPLQLSQLHADAVFLLLGLSIALVVVHPSRAVVALVVVELAQGTIGFVQYFTGLPIVLVGFHLLGAAVLTAVMTWALLDVRATARADAPASTPRPEPLVR
jgi:cytochrome c oxidase assembly protein subunit 15